MHGYSLPKLSGNHVPAASTSPRGGIFEGVASVKERLVPLPPSQLVDSRLQLFKQQQKSGASSSGRASPAAAAPSTRTCPSPIPAPRPREPPRPRYHAHVNRRGLPPITPESLRATDAKFLSRGRESPTRAFTSTFREEQVNSRASLHQRELERTYDQLLGKEHALENTIAAQELHCLRHKARVAGLQQTLRTRHARWVCNNVQRKERQRLHAHIESNAPLRDSDRDVQVRKIEVCDPEPYSVPWFNRELLPPPPPRRQPFAPMGGMQHTLPTSPPRPTCASGPPQNFFDVPSPAGRKSPTIHAAQRSLDPPKESRFDMRIMPELV